MKTIKGTAFFFFSLLLGSCFSPPEFSIIPSITINTNDDLKFIDASSGADTLIVVVHFQDGDGDLGLADDQVYYPYHAANYYLAGDGDTMMIAPKILDLTFPPILDIPTGAQGKLATNHTREEAGFGNIFPPYECPYRSEFYRYDSIFVLEQDKDIFDDTYTLKRTYHSSLFDQDVYMLYDTFYYRANPYQYNIEIDFLVQGNNGFEIFDWKKELCVGSDYDGRFPVLSAGGTPLEGDLKYSIIGTGFVPLFSGKIMKLRIRIRDRALHTSDDILTDQFTLEQIRE